MTEVLALSGMTERKAFLQNPARRESRASSLAETQAEEVSATVRPFAFGRSPLAWVGLYFNALRAALKSRPQHC